jgi:hypothetical protein
LATRLTRSNPSFRLLLALAILASVVLAATHAAWASSARSSSAKPTHCGTIFARNYFDGKNVGISVVRHADCGTARQVLRYYYNSGAPCAGSGCVLTTPSGWSCDTNPGEVQQKTGVITVCTKGHGMVESHILRATAAAAAKAVYVNCQNQAGVGFHAAVRPSRCVLVGEPETSASTVRLVGTTTRVKVRVRLYRIVQGCGAHGSRPYYYTDAGVTLEDRTGTLELPFDSC